MNAKFVRIEVLVFERLLVWNGFGVVCVYFMVGEW
jgi:hypothetical protein